VCLSVKYSVESSSAEVTCFVFVLRNTTYSVDIIKVTVVLVLRSKV
jgi:hypothetical protein